MDDVDVVKLTDKNNEYFETICDWIYNWWGTKNGWSYQKVYEYMEHSLCENTMPETFVAVHNGIAIGMYQIAMTDLDTRPDLYPWLTLVYVEEKYRGRGLSKLLVEHSIKESKKLGIKKLYLYTAHIGLYERFGWEFIENVNTYIKDSPIERLYVYNIGGSNEK